MSFPNTFTSFNMSASAKICTPSAQTIFHQLMIMSIMQYCKGLCLTLCCNSCCLIFWAKLTNIIFFHVADVFPPLTRCVK